MKIGRYDSGTGDVVFAFAKAWVINDKQPVTVHQVATEEDSGMMESEVELVLDSLAGKGDLIFTEYPNMFESAGPSTIYYAPGPYLKGLIGGMWSDRQGVM